MLGCGPSLYALRSPALTLQANAQALERVLAAAGSPAPLGPAGTGAADTLGACAAVPRRARRAGGALALVSGAGHDALALADLTKVPRSTAPRPLTRVLRAALVALGWRSRPAAPRAHDLQQRMLQAALGVLGWRSSRAAPGERDLRLHRSGRCNARGRRSCGVPARRCTALHAWPGFRLCEHRQAPSGGRLPRGGRSRCCSCATGAASATRRRSTWSRRMWRPRARRCSCSCASACCRARGTRDPGPRAALTAPDTACPRADCMRCKLRRRQAFATCATSVADGVRRNSRNKLLACQNTQRGPPHTQTNVHTCGNAPTCAVTKSATDKYTALRSLAPSPTMCGRARRARVTAAAGTARGSRPPGASRAAATPAAQSQPPAPPRHKRISKTRDAPPLLDRRSSLPSRCTCRNLPRV